MSIWFVLIAVAIIFPVGLLVAAAYRLDQMRSEDD